MEPLITHVELSGSERHPNASCRSNDKNAHGVRHCLAPPLIDILLPGLPSCQIYLHAAAPHFRDDQIECHVGINGQNAAVVFAQALCEHVHILVVLCSSVTGFLFGCHVVEVGIAD